MHKIYSRRRIKIPKISIKSKHKIRNEKTEKIITIWMILSIAFLTVKVILDAVLPIFDTLCENRAKSISTIVSNEQATNIMKEHSYDELFTIEKDHAGNIVMIKSNVISMNEIISDVANKIQEEMDQKGRENIEIALRKFYRVKVISRKRTTE